MPDSSAGRSQRTVICVRAVVLSMESNSPATHQSDAAIVQLDTASELDALVSETGTVLVEFYTAGCGICQQMEPVLGNVARELDIRVATINPRDDPPLVDRFDVRSVPLFVLFVDGDPLARLADGFIAGEELTTWIKAHADC